MILRTRDIPELTELTEEHRQQVISQVERMVFWKPKSVLLCFTLILGFVAHLPAVKLVDEFFGNQGGPGGFFTAITSLTLCFLYRLVGINSFYRPAIRSLCESGVPPKIERPVASRFETLVVVSFVLGVLAVFCTLIFRN